MSSTSWSTGGSTTADPSSPPRLTISPACRRWIRDAALIRDRLMKGLGTGGVGRWTI